MGSGIELREYRPADLEFVRELFERYLVEEAARVPVLGLSPGFVDEYLPRLVRKTQEEGGLFVIAEVDGVPAGYVAALPKDAEPWDQTVGRTVMLMELHVSADHRRRGIGRALVSAVERTFAARGIDWITLGTMAGNSDAHAVYRAMGFAPTYLFLGRRVRSEP